MAKERIGILAYGSLLSNQGCEIKKYRHSNKPIDVEEIPFPVEFARKSGTRRGAPTLVPFQDSKKVKGRIFEMDCSIEKAADVLFRREIHDVCGSKTYASTGRGIKFFDHQSIEWEKNDEHDTNVYIKYLAGIKPLDKVLFTWLNYNIHLDNDVQKSARHLANLAINSYKQRKKEGEDGITYLKNALDYGIETKRSEAYKQEILIMQNCQDLDEVLKKLESSDSH